MLRASLSRIRLASDLWAWIRAGGSATFPAALSCPGQAFACQAKITGRSRHLKSGHFGDIEAVGYGVSNCYQTLNDFKFKVG